MERKINRVTNKMKLNKTAWALIAFIVFVIFSNLTSEEPKQNSSEEPKQNSSENKINNKEKNYAYEWSLTTKGTVKCKHVGKGNEAANGGEKYVFNNVEYIFIPNGDKEALITNAANACTTDWTSMEGEPDDGFIASIDKDFNSPIGHWDVSNVTNMNWLFKKANSFNQDISTWDVSNVEAMDGMFNHAVEFNQDISGWDVQNVYVMDLMFAYTKKFNQNIGGWKTENTKYMEGMFLNALAFNQDISGWDTSNVVTMYSMFEKTSSFNQDLSNWNVSKVEHARCFSYESKFANNPQKHPKFKVDSSCAY